MRQVLGAAGLAIVLAVAPAAGAGVLLYDAFTAPALDAGMWHQPTGCGTWFGRTQIRPPAFPLESAGGALRLPLESFNPSGLSFWGSEIVSNAEFAPPEGGVLSVSARVRLASPTLPGFDASLFLYRVRAPATACDASPLRDEIDFELLSSQIGSGQVLTNVYDAEAIGGAGAPEYPILAGFDPRAWHELEIRWARDRIEWRVDGALVRVETERVPAGPMAVRPELLGPGRGVPASLRIAARSGERARRQPDLALRGGRGRGADAARARKRLRRAQRGAAAGAASTRSSSSWIAALLATISLPDAGTAPPARSVTRPPASSTIRIPAATSQAWSLSSQ